MEQRNEQLKQVLIKQYSKLSHTSEFKLTEKLKNIDWWAKEQHRLKIQYNLSLTGSCIVFLCLCFIIIITLLKGAHDSIPYAVPFASLAGVIFPLFFVVKIHSTMGEKIRLFELMQILFDNNKSEVHHY